MTVARTRWEPHPETCRVCGKGALGVYQGPPLWSLVAVDKARSRLAGRVPVAEYVPGESAVGPPRAAETPVAPSGRLPAFDTQGVAGPLLNPQGLVLEEAPQDVLRARLVLGAPSPQPRPRHHAITEALKLPRGEPHTLRQRRGDGGLRQLPGGVQNVDRTVRNSRVAHGLLSKSGFRNRVSQGPTGRGAANLHEGESSHDPRLCTAPPSVNQTPFRLTARQHALLSRHEDPP